MRKASFSKDLWILELTKYYDAMSSFNFIDLPLKTSNTQKIIRIMFAEYLSSIRLTSNLDANRFANGLPTKMTSILCFKCNNLNEIKGTTRQTTIPKWIRHNLILSLTIGCNSSIVMKEDYAR